MTAKLIATAVTFQMVTGAQHVVNHTCLANINYWRLRARAHLSFVIPASSKGDAQGQTQQSDAQQHVVALSAKREARLRKVMLNRGRAHLRLGHSIATDAKYKIHNIKYVEHKI